MDSCSSKLLNSNWHFAWGQICININQKYMGSSLEVFLNFHHWCQFTWWKKALTSSTTTLINLDLRVFLITYEFSLRTKLHDSQAVAYFNLCVYQASVIHVICSNYCLLGAETGNNWSFNKTQTSREGSCQKNLHWLQDRIRVKMVMFDCMHSCTLVQSSPCSKTSSH